jgi:hypothetical protein
MDIKVVHNLLPNMFVNDIEYIINSQNFPWQYSSSSVKLPFEVNNPLVKEVDLYSTVIFKDGINYNEQLFHFFYSILYFLEEHCAGWNLHRIHVNKLLKSEDYPDSCYQTPHHDCGTDKKQYKTFLYYVNDSDGETVFFNEYGLKHVNNPTICYTNKPKKNSLVIFDSQRLHSSTPPRIYDNRVVVNIVMEQ